jgi:hypothetical protein
MNKKDYQYVSVSDITFQLSDDEGNILENADGTIKEFYFKGRLKNLGEGDNTVDTYRDDVVRVQRT